MGTHIGGRGLDRTQAVRRGWRGPEDRRVRAERPVARDRPEQQPDQPVGHSAGPHPRIHVHRRRQPADQGQHGRQRHQGDRHGRRVQGFGRVRRHTGQPAILVRLAAGLHRNRGLRWQRPASDPERASGTVAVPALGVREQGILVGWHQTGYTERQQVRSHNRIVRIQEPRHQGPEIRENRPFAGPERR